MQDIPAIDPGRQINWSLTSADYAAHRPGPPARLYDMLALLGVGVPGQHLLDLGTGTGLVAREFARRGCIVSGTDIALGQIEAARAQAQSEALKIDFQVAPAEACPHADASFDIVTASQCWLYFDAERAIAEVKRVLKPGGLLVTTHFSWLALADPIASASEQLVLRFNPAWKGANWPGKVPSVPPVVGRPRRGAGHVLVRRSRAVHTRELARPHARLPRGCRHLVRGRGGRLRCRAREAAGADSAAAVHRAAPGRCAFVPPAVRSIPCPKKDFSALNDRSGTSYSRSFLP